MLAGSMIRNTNWTRVNAQLVNWTGGESGTRASMANSVGEWTASAGKNCRTNVEQCDQFNNQRLRKRGR
nr:hypothetical protein [Escherichia coli]